jgi:hypothetical protein
MERHRKFKKKKACRSFRGDRLELERLPRGALSHGSSLKEMHDNRYHREQQQQVDQRARNVKHQEAAKPQQQQNYEQYQKHGASFTLTFRLRPVSRRLLGCQN